MFAEAPRVVLDIFLQCELFCKLQRAVICSSHLLGTQGLRPARTSWFQLLPTIRAEHRKIKPCIRDLRERGQQVEKKVRRMAK